MIPDFKQQISELEKQKQELELRLQEQTEKMKGAEPAPSLGHHVGQSHCPQSLGCCLGLEGTGRWDWSPEGRRGAAVGAVTPASPRREDRRAVGPAQP